MNHASSSPCAEGTIAVTGARGQLGHQVCELLGRRAIPLDRQAMDITSRDEVERVLAKLRPQVLLNAAAYTAVDQAEEHPETCFRVNQRAVRTLAEVTAQLNCRLVQISTDYVFAGSLKRTPLNEKDATEPVGVYARSKARSEDEARCHPNHLIIRTCGVYGPPRTEQTTNFVNTLLRLGRERESLKVVNDQCCSPTWVFELARAVIHLIDQQRTGLYHLVNQGGLSWYELAQLIFETADIDCGLSPISTEEYNAPAPRPVYSVLDISKYEATGGPPMSTCRDALIRYLSQLSTAGEPYQPTPFMREAGSHQQLKS